MACDAGDSTEAGDCEVDDCNGIARDIEYDADRIRFVTGEFEDAGGGGTLLELVNE